VLASLFAIVEGQIPSNHTTREGALKV